jgi:tetratricopeptide (TPR) repeat protein
MKSLHRSLSTQAILCFLLVGCCLLAPTSLLGWPQEQAKYTEEEYKAYQAITAENEAAKKIELVVSFFKTYPKSALHDHVTAAYQAVMNGALHAQRYNQLISFGEQLLAVNPNDTYTMSMLASGYQQTKNVVKFVAVGEKVFAAKPDGNLAYYLAKAYLEMRNDPKFLQWAQRAVELIPNNHELLLELAKAFGAAKKNAEAGKYARLCIKAIDTATKPEGTDDKLWNDYKSNAYANCYAIIGTIAHEQRDYNSAVTNLETSLKYFKRNDLAYYYLGLSYWQLNKVDMAMLNLAKAYVLGRTSAGPAKQHLDNLYKSTHQQTLVGQDRVINRARAELK